MTTGEMIADFIQSNIMRGELSAVAVKQANDNMLESTLDGRGVTNGRYDSTYSEAYARRQGKQGQRVNLRSNKPATRSIETVGYEVDGYAAQVTFREKAQIFEYHQKGTAKGGKVREIYAETVNQLDPNIFEAFNHEIINQMKKAGL